VPAAIGGRLDGELLVGGCQAGRDPQAQVARRVGIVFQDPESQLVMERVDDEVAFGLESLGWPAGEMRARVPEALAELGAHDPDVEIFLPDVVATMIAGGETVRVLRSDEACIGITYREDVDALRAAQS